MTDTVDSLLAATEPLVKQPQSSIDALLAETDPLVGKPPSDSIDSLLSETNSLVSPTNPAPESVLKTAGREAATGVVPAAGGLGGALALGAAGAELGTVAGPIGTAVGGVGGAIVGGIIGEKSVNKLQRAVLEAVKGKEWVAEQDAQSEANRQANPNAAGAGQLIGDIPMFLSGGGVARKVGQKLAGGASKLSQAYNVAVEAGKQAKLGQRVIRAIPQEAGSIAAFGGMSGGAVAKNDNATVGDIANEAAKGAVGGAVLGGVGGAMSLMPAAKSLLGKYAVKPVADAAALAISNAVYDHAVNGKDIDAKRIEEETGGSIPAFVLMTAAQGLLHHPGSLAVRNRLDGQLKAYGVADETLKGMDSEDKARALTTIRENVTPERAVELTKQYHPNALSAYHEVHEKTGAFSTPDEKAAYVKSVVERVAPGVNTEVYNNEAELVAAHPEVAANPQYKAGQFRGLYVPAVRDVDGTVTKPSAVLLTLDNMPTPEAAVSTVLHEAGLHDALDRIMSSEDKRKLLNNLGGKAFKQAKALKDRMTDVANQTADNALKGIAGLRDTDPKAYETQAAAIEANRNAELMSITPDLTAEEALAVLRENAGANPSAYQRGVAMVRSKLRQRFPSLRFNDSDIEVLFADAAKAVKGEGTFERKGTPTVIADEEAKAETPTAAEPVSSTETAKGKPEVVETPATANQPPAAEPAIATKPPEATETQTPAQPDVTARAQTPVEAPVGGSEVPAREQVSVPSDLSPMADRVGARVTSDTPEKFEMRGRIDVTLDKTDTTNWARPANVKLPKTVYALHSLEVASDAEKGKWLGMQTLDIAKKYATRNGLPIYLEARANDEGRQQDLNRFYEKNGFTRIDGLQDTFMWTPAREAAVQPEAPSNAVGQPAAVGDVAVPEADTKRPLGAQREPDAVDADASKPWIPTPQELLSMKRGLAEQASYDDVLNAKAALENVSRRRAMVFQASFKEDTARELDLPRDALFDMSYNDWSALSRDIDAMHQRAQDAWDRGELGERDPQTTMGVIWRRYAERNPTQVSEIRQRHNLTLPAVQPESPSNAVGQPAATAPAEATTPPVATQAPQEGPLPKPAKPAARKAKLGETPPWKRTQAEWRETGVAEARKASPDQPEQWYVAQADRVHKAEVGRAVQQGKDVPAAVMADYPDIAAKVEASAARKAAKEQAASMASAAQAVERSADTLAKVADAVQLKATQAAKVKASNEKAQAPDEPPYPDLMGYQLQLMTPSEVSSKRQEQTDAFVAYTREKMAEREQELTETPKSKRKSKWDDATWSQLYDSIRSAKERGGVNSDESLHRSAIMTAINHSEGYIAGKPRVHDPVNAAAVDAYDIKLPEGYVRDGDRYVFKPTTTTKEASDAAQAVSESVSVQGERQGNGEGGAPRQAERGGGVPSPAEGAVEGQVAAPQVSTVDTSAKTTAADAATLKREFARERGLTRESLAAMSDADRKALDGEFAKWWRSRQAGAAKFKRTDLQTETPEFKAWFGDSKVVDKDGKPLVVYHGTNHDITEFQANKSGDKTGNPNAPLGFFFSPSTAEASRYAMDWGATGGNVMPVYLSIRNPYRMPYSEFNKLAMTSWDLQIQDPSYDANKIIKFGDTEGQRIAAERRAKYDAMAREQTLKRRDELIRDGYDGVVTRVGGKEEYIAFAPTQIKSATGNVGTFDATNPDIRFRRTDLATATPDDLRAEADATDDAARAKQLRELAGWRDKAFGGDFAKSLAKDEDARLTAALEAGDAETPDIRFKRTDLDEADGEKRYIRAIPSEDPAARALIARYEEVYDSEYTPRRVDGYMADGEADYKADPKRAEFALLANTSMSGKVEEDAPRMAREKVAIDAMARRAVDTLNEGDIQRAGVAAYNWYKHGSDTSLALRLRFDPLKTPEQRRAYLDRAIVAPSDAEAEALRRAQNSGKSMEDQAAIMAPSARRAMQTLAELKRLGLDYRAFSDDELMNPAKMREVLNAISADRSSRGDKVHEWWRNAILSAPTTQIVNAMGNASNATMEALIQRPVQVLLNNFVKSPDAATANSLKAMYKAVVPSLSQANKNFWTALATEHNVTGNEGSKLDSSNVAWRGKFGKNVVRLPQRVMTAVDEWFKTVFMSMLTADYATREFDAKLKSGAKKRGGDAYTDADRDGYMTAAMQDGTSAYNKAWNETLHWSFQQQNGVIGQSFSRLRNDPTFGFLIKFVLPFVKTPANIVSTGLRKSPANLLPVLYKLSTGKYAGSAEANALGVKEGAEQVVALVALASIWGLTQGDPNDPLNRPRLTGSRKTGANSTPGEREAELRDRPPLSIRFGDKWVSYSRLEPFATVLSTMADIMTAANEATSGKGDEIPQTVLSSFKSNFQDKTFLSGVGDIIDIIESGDEGKLTQFFTRIAAGFVPNIAKAAVRSFDPYVRETRNKDKGKSWLKTSAERFAQQAWPSQSIAAPPRYDISGKPLTKEGSPAYQFFVPFRKQDAARMTKVDAMLNKWNDTAQDYEKFTPATPAAPVIKQLGSKAPIPLSDQERGEYQRIAGEIASKRLAGMTFNYDAPTERDIARVRKVYELSREVARRRITPIVLKRWREESAK